MDIVVEMRFGSHLYGTATAESDLDFKGVYLPAGQDILLQRAAGHVSVAGRGERNAPGDVDREFYSLQRYLNLLAEGQTVALDMLFAPDDALVGPPSALWREIRANASRLVTRRAGLFVRYCRQQANKFGIKGARVAAARRTLALLEAAEARHGGGARLEAAAADLRAGMGAHVAFTDIAMPGGRIVRHLDLCGRKMPFTGTIKSARETARRLVGAYGERALGAERHEGVDWKALSHAVRVGREAVELFGTGRITLPLPCAAEIVAIKRGALPYEAVAETIEGLLVAVEAAAETSSLPETADRDFIEALVARAYRGKVADGP